MRRDKALRAIAICLVVLPLETLSQLSISPAEQAKIEKGFEAAKYYAKGAAKQVTKIQEGFEAAEKTTKAFTKLTKSIQFIGKFSKFLGPAGMALSIIFTVFADSPTDRLSQQMTREFEGVNKKLDGIYDKFNEVEENLKDFIDAKLEINQLVDYANIILNSKKKFKHLLNNLKDISPNDPDYTRNKMKMMEEFHNFYENTGVEAALYNLVRMLDVTTPLPPLKKDLFASFREAVDCDTGRMSSLFTYIGMILLDGVQQNMAYVAIKRGPDAAQDEDPMKWFHTLQIGYQTSALHCYNNVLSYAPELAKKGGSSKEISERLKKNYSWLNWAVGKKTKETKISGSNYFEVPLIKENATIVVLWQDANITAEHSVESLDGEITRKEICSGSDVNLCLTCKNMDIFSVEYYTGDFKVYHLRDLNLDDFTKADNLEDRYAPKEMMRGIYDHLDEDIPPPNRNFSIHPKRCGINLPNIFELDSNMFELDSESSALNFFATILPSALKFFGTHGCNVECMKDFLCFGSISNYARLCKYTFAGGKNDWVVGEEPNVDNPCRELHQEDLRRGTCHNIEYTSHFVVLCNFGYHGDHCQDTLDPNVTDVNLSPLMDILDQRTLSSLPSLVDVFFDVRQLGDKIEGIKEVINDNTNQLSFQIQHTEVLKDLVYIIDEYDKYMSDSDRERISGDTFMHRIHKQFSQKDISRFLFDLDDALKNKYLSYEKKKIAAAYGVCTTEYQEKVESFKKYTLMTERVFRTSLLMYINTDMYKDEIEQNEAIWRDYEREIKQDFELKKYWREGSCPAFYPFQRTVHVGFSGISASVSGGNCSETESFEGAQIRDFLCYGNEYPSIKRALCTRKNGKLDWDIEMSSTCQRFETSKDLECISYQWSNWSTWSSCDQDCSCGKEVCEGRQKRTRRCEGKGEEADDLCCPSPETEKTEETKVCYAQDCCKANGQWSCSDGKCISKDKLCNGNRDCSGGEDEKSSACPGVLRSHDIIGLRVSSSCHVKPKYMSFLGDYYPWMVTSLSSHEYVKIIKSNNNAGDKIQDGDKVAFQILYNNNAYKKKKSWLGCKCNDYCQRTSCPSGHNNKISNKCRWEWFHIKNTGSSKSIGRSDTVYFYRVFGCGYNKITANSDEYVKLFYSGLGPCEKWGIRLYLSYDQTIPPFYN